MRKQSGKQDLGTAIILAVQELYKRKYKSAVSEERKYLNCQDLLANPNITRLMTIKKSTIMQGQKQAFLKTIKQVLANNPIYSVLERCIKEKTRVTFIKRNCPYEKIQNFKKLAEHVFINYTGVFVDDELLNYTYPNILADIEKAVRQNMFIRMSLIGKNEESYYLFFNLEAQQLRLKNWKTNEYQGQYLSICKQFGKKEERSMEQKKIFQIQLDVNQSDPNYDLPNFLQLKKQWKMKQALKSMAQAEEDRKAELKQIQQMKKKS